WAGCSPLGVRSARFSSLSFLALTPRSVDTTKCPPERSEDDAGPRSPRGPERSEQARRRAHYVRPVVVFIGCLFGVSLSSGLPLRDIPSRSPRPATFPSSDGWRKPWERSHAFFRKNTSALVKFRPSCQARQARAPRCAERGVQPVPCQGDGGGQRVRRCGVHARWRLLPRCPWSLRGARTGVGQAPDLRIDQLPIEAVV